MEYTHTALTGLHTPEIAKLISLKLERSGYQVTQASSLEEMKEIIGISQGGVPSNLFGLYLMDINLGFRGGYTYDPISQIYTPLKPTLGERSTIIGISGNPNTVDIAKQAGIPNCFLSTQIREMFLIIDQHEKILTPGPSSYN